MQLDYSYRKYTLSQIVYYHFCGPYYAVEVVGKWMKISTKQIPVRVGTG